MNSDGWEPPSPKPNSMLDIARSMRVACRSENTNSPLPSMRLMNSWMLSPSIEARKPSPNFCISFCAVTSPMVGMRFKALSAAEASDDGAAVRAARHVAMAGATPGEDRLPVEAHPHPHAPQDEELLACGLHPQLLAQLDQLDQGVRAVEHPDLGTGHRLVDFPVPLVDQVGRREHQGAAVAFGIEYGGRVAVPTVVLPRPIPPLTIAARSPRSISSLAAAWTTSACASNNLRLRLATTIWRCACGGPV